MKHYVLIKLANKSVSAINNSKVLSIFTSPQILVIDFNFKFNILIGVSAFFFIVCRYNYIKGSEVSKVLTYIQIITK